MVFGLFEGGNMLYNNILYNIYIYTYTLYSIVYKYIYIYIYYIIYIYIIYNILYNIYNIYIYTPVHGMDLAMLHINLDFQPISHDPSCRWSIDAETPVP